MLNIDFIFIANISTKLYLKQLFINKGHLFLFLLWMSSIEFVKRCPSVGKTAGEPVLPFILNSDKPQKQLKTTKKLQETDSSIPAQRVHCCK